VYEYFFTEFSQKASNKGKVIVVKVITFNGSPRKTWNTGTLLSKALEGAASQGAEAELIYLYDLNYKGCIQLFCMQN
jgi:multimeric flavodoxin WrbA